MFRQWWMIAVVMVAGSSLLVGAAGLVSGGHDPKSAIERVLVEDKAAFVEAQTLVKQRKLKPIAAAQAMIKRMKAQDLSNCPSDFREAYMRHALAWEGLTEFSRQAPQDLVDAIIFVGINMFGGKQDGGAVALRDAGQARTQALTASWREVEAISAKYDARHPE